MSEPAEPTGRSGRKRRRKPKPPPDPVERIQSAASLCRFCGWVVAAGVVLAMADGSSNVAVSIWWAIAFGLWVSCAFLRALADIADRLGTAGPINTTADREG